MKRSRAHDEFSSPLRAETGWNGELGGHFSAKGQRSEREGLKRLEPPRAAPGRYLEGELHKSPARKGTGFETSGRSFKSDWEHAKSSPRKESSTERNGLQNGVGFRSSRSSGYGGKKGFVSDMGSSDSLEGQKRDDSQGSENNQPTGVATPRKEKQKNEEGNGRSPTKKGSSSEGGETAKSHGRDRGMRTESSSTKSQVVKGFGGFSREDRNCQNVPVSPFKREYEPKLQFPKGSRSERDRPRREEHAKLVGLRNTPAPALDRLENKAKLPVAKRSSMEVEIKDLGPKGDAEVRGWEAGFKAKGPRTSRTRAYEENKALHVQGFCKEEGGSVSPSPAPADLKDVQLEGEAEKSEKEEGELEAEDENEGSDKDSFQSPEKKIVDEDTARTEEKEDALVKAGTSASPPHGKESIVSKEDAFLSQLPVETKELVDMEVEGSAKPASDTGLNTGLKTEEPLEKETEISGGKETMNQTGDETEAKDEPARVNELALMLPSSQVAGSSEGFVGRERAMFVDPKEVQVSRDEENSSKRKMHREVEPHVQRTREGGAEMDPLGERHRHKRQRLDQLDPSFLSLALPDTSLSLGSARRAPRSPNRGKSTQSVSHTETFSNGITTSLSLSCSHQFAHNPSCSLTQTSQDNNQEFSSASQPVSETNDHHSRPMYGNEQFGQTSSRLMNERQRSYWDHGNGTWGFEQGGAKQAYQGSVGIQPHQKDANDFPVGFQDRKTGFHDRQRRANMDTQSVGSWDKSSEQHKAILEREGCRSEKILSARPPLHGDIISRRQSLKPIGLREIVSEPISVVAQKLQELPDSHLEAIKESLKEMSQSADKRDEFVQLQRVLLRRTDLSSQMLSRAHRTQLEIFVALKTGIQGYLLRENTNNIKTEALAEILLQTRCRNILCQVQLPNDDCECQICSQKNGFCSACMCVVCSKFDYDNNTCRWVGCDVCLHWCHLDCGLNMSYITPRGTPGASQMQFQCIGCGSSSELFGFVKDVFMNFAKDWGRETLAKELEYVRRIFQQSEDTKGKHLCWKAEQLLAKLEDMADTSKVCKSMLRFFTDEDLDIEISQGTATKSAQPSETTKNADNGRDLVVHPVTLPTANEPADLDRARAALQTYDRELEEKRTEAAEIQHDRARQKEEIKELESIVLVKHAEAQMFQNRADEARREAEALQRIVLAKCEKIDEEYEYKLTKLHINEVEERRRKRLEELQMFERGLGDFNSMKARLINDIQDLLQKMEATKSRVFCGNQNR